jgi:hypothetical protein
MATDDWEDEIRRKSGRAGERSGRAGERESGRKIFQISDLLAPPDFVGVRWTMSKESAKHAKFLSFFACFV